MFLRSGEGFEGLGIWTRDVYCLFLKFENGDCLPGEGELEVQEGPGVGAVQKTTKQYRSRDKVVRAEVLGLSQRRGKEKPVPQL